MPLLSQQQLLFCVYALLKAYVLFHHIAYMRPMTLPAMAKGSCSAGY